MESNLVFAYFEMARVGSTISYQLVFQNPMEKMKQNETLKIWLPQPQQNSGNVGSHDGILA